MREGMDGIRTGRGVLYLISPGRSRCMRKRSLSPFALVEWAVIYMMCLP